MRQWFTMTKHSPNDGGEGGVGEIVIYDAIGKSFWNEDAIGAKAFLESLAALGDVNAITLRINSPGGDVFDGLAIHNSLKNHSARVTAHIDGLAASAASYIAMAADKIVMPANSFMLVHQAAGFALGTADDMRALADDLERIDNSITATYAARTNMTNGRVKALMKEDRLMSASEAKEFGFADEVVKETKMAANYSLHLLPKAAADKFRAETGSGQGDPPLPATAPEPEDLPIVPPVPPATAEPAAPPAAANVVDLNAARQQGIEEHRAYVAMVTDLCTLARASERVGDYVRANTPIEKVRAELLAAAAEVPEVLPQHPLASSAAKVNADAWTKITDKINARVK